jgi:hypothetical protein
MTIVNEALPVSAKILLILYLKISINLDTESYMSFLPLWVMNFMKSEDQMCQANFFYVSGGYLAVVLKII